MQIEVGLISSVAITLLLLLLSRAGCENLGDLQQVRHSEPVVGGFLFALVVLGLREWGSIELTVDTTLQSPATLAFFSTIGLGASLSLIKTGGRFLDVYLLACWSVAILQNLVGSG